MKKNQITKQNFKISGNGTIIDLAMINDQTLMTEEAITILKQKQQELRDPLEFTLKEVIEAQAILNEANYKYQIFKTQHDNIEDNIKLKMNSIKAFNLIKAGKTVVPKIETEIFTKISNTVGAKVKLEKQKPVDIQQAALRTLLKANRFMAPRELFDYMLEVDDVYKEAFAQYPDKSNSRKKSVALGLYSSAVLIPKHHKKVKLITAYGEKIGLPQWLNENGTLRPERMLDFMGTEISSDIKPIHNKHLIEA